MMLTTTDLSGSLSVWGGGLAETQWLHCDSHGNIDGGPVVPDQEEIEEQIAAGQTSSETAGGVCWRRI